MRPRAGARLLWAVTLSLLALLAGCVSVPTAGPIEKVEGQQPGCQNCVNVEVAPPAAGDSPRQIVEGYLRATSNYQPNYSVAKQFLTRGAAEKWSPEDGASIYRGAPVAVGSTVTLSNARLVGSLARDRTYTARDQELNVDFGLVKENGEWRIGKPPPGLMVAEYSFTTFYQPFELYFVANGSSLVPDPIYLPVLRNPANVASALMKALLSGPSTWLKPAVTTAIPPNTTLSVDSVTITDGVAEVPLSDSVLALSDQQRSLLAAQIVYTLRQVVGIKGVLVTVNQQRYRLPEGDPNSLVVDVTAIPPELDPIPYGVGDELYVVRDGAVGRVAGSADAPRVTPLDGPLGEGRYAVDALAVSVSNTDLALVTDGRTALRKAPTTSGELQSLIQGVSGLLRPQFSRYGEIWAIGRQGGRQRLWLMVGDTRVEVSTPMFGGGDVTAFKVSPDGTRMAVVRRTALGVELGIMRISRSDRTVVDGWRSLDLTQTSMPQITRIGDVGWLDATDLMVLGAAGSDASLGPFRVAEDASKIVSAGEPNNRDAVEVAVLLRTQSAVIRGRSGQTWRNDSGQWLPYLDNVSTLAYPG